MKYRILIYTILFSASALADERNCVGSSGGLDEDVRLLLQCGISEGTRDKEIRRSGDNAAIAVARFIADKPITDKEVDSALYIFDQAFSHPEWIDDPSYRKPRVTLLLLRYFALTIHSTELRTRIEQATKKTQSIE